MDFPDNSFSCPSYSRHSRCSDRHGCTPALGRDSARIRHCHPLAVLARIASLSSLPSRRAAGPDLGILFVFSGIDPRVSERTAGLGARSIDDWVSFGYTLGGMLQDNPYGSDILRAFVQSATDGLSSPVKRTTTP